MNELKAKILRDILEAVKTNFLESDLCINKPQNEINEILLSLQNKSPDNEEGLLHQQKKEDMSVLFKEFILSLSLQTNMLEAEIDIFEKLFLAQEILPVRGFIKFVLKKNIVENSLLKNMHPIINENIYQWFINNISNKNWFSLIAKSVQDVNERYDKNVKEKSKEYNEIWNSLYIELLYKYRNENHEAHSQDLIKGISDKILFFYKDNANIKNINIMLSNVEKKLSAIWFFDRKEGILLSPMYLNYLDLLNNLEKYEQYENVINEKKKTHIEQIREDGVNFINENEFKEYLSSKDLKNHMFVKGNNIFIKKSKLDIYDIHSFISQKKMGESFTAEKNIFENFEIYSVKIGDKESNEYMKIRWDFVQDIENDQTKFTKLKAELIDYLTETIINVDNVSLIGGYLSKERDIREFLLNLKLYMKNNNNKTNIVRRKI